MYHALFEALEYCVVPNILDKSRERLVGIETGYGLNGRSSIPGKGNKFFSTPQCPDRHWGLPRLLCNSYHGQGVKLTTRLHLLPRSRSVELELHSRIRLYCLVRN
jgi:hypothetical protein